MINDSTFQDVIDHGFDYLGGNPSDQVRRDCVRAALEAYRDLANAFNWSYLYTHSRIYTSGYFDGSQTGATIAYDHTGGTYERMVTLTGGTWPDWAGSGTWIRVASGDLDTSGDTTGFVVYRVAERKSASVPTLSETINPEVDIAAGTQFMLYRDTYVLPEVYAAQDQALFERNFGGMTYTHPRSGTREPLRVRPGRAPVPHDSRRPAVPGPTGHADLPVAVRVEVDRLHLQALPDGAGDRWRPGRHGVGDQEHRPRHGAGSIVTGPAQRERSPAWVALGNGLHGRPDAAV